MIDRDDYDELLTVLDDRFVSSASPFYAPLLMMIMILCCHSHDSIWLAALVHLHFFACGSAACVRHLTFAD